MKGERTNRVAEEMRRELSDLVLFSVRDPRLAELKFTQVKMTPDLRIAKVYFYSENDAAKDKEIISGLQSSKGFFRTEIGKRLKLRSTPDFLFYPDDSLHKQNHIEALLKTISK